MQAYLLALAGLLGAATAQAQTTFSLGPRLGGHLASGTFSNVNQPVAPGASESYSRHAVVGFQVGLAASVGSGHWAFQPALLLSQKGVGQRATASYGFGSVQLQEEIEADARINYLELPLNVVYGFGADGQGFQVFAGPYLALGVGGRVQYTYAFTSNTPGLPNQSSSGSQGMQFGNTFADVDPNDPNAEPEARARRFDAGLNAGIGYRRGPVQVQLGYGLGLLNVQPDYPASYQLSNDTGYNRVAQLTATYFFAAGGK